MDDEELSSDDELSGDDEATSSDQYSNSGDGGDTCQEQETQLSTDTYAGKGTAVSWAFEDVDQMMASAGISLDAGDSDYPVA